MVATVRLLVSLVCSAAACSYLRLRMEGEGEWGVRLLNGSLVDGGSYAAVGPVCAPADECFTFEISGSSGWELDDTVVGTAPYGPGIMSLEEDTLTESCDGVLSCRSSCEDACLYVVSSTTYKLETYPDDHLFVEANAPDYADELCLGPRCYTLEAEDWRLGTAFEGSGEVTFRLFENGTVSRGCETTCERSCDGRCYAVTGVVTSRTEVLEPTIDGEVCFESSECYELADRAEIVGEEVGSRFSLVDGALVSGCGGDDALFVCGGAEDTTVSLGVLCSELDLTTSCLCSASLCPAGQSDDECAAVLSSSCSSSSSSSEAIVVQASVATSAELQQALDSACASSTLLEGRVLEVPRVLKARSNAFARFGDGSLVGGRNFSDRILLVEMEAIVELHNLSISNGTDDASSLVVGGGCIAVGADATLELSDVRLENCFAAIAGGAVSLWRGANLTLQRTYFKANYASSSGGCVYGFDSNTIRSSDSTFESCASDVGGGIFASRGVVTSRSDVFFACTAADAGGAMYGVLADVASLGTVFRNCSGGGIVAPAGVAALDDATFSGCVAPTKNSSSSAIEASYVSLVNSTVEACWGGGAVITAALVALLEQSVFRECEGDVAVAETCIVRSSVFASNAGGGAIRARDDADVSNSTFLDSEEGIVANTIHLASSNLTGFAGTVVNAFSNATVSASTIADSSTTALSAAGVLFLERTQILNCHGLAEGAVVATAASLTDETVVASGSSGARGGCVTASILNIDATSTIAECSAASDGGGAYVTQKLVLAGAIVGCASLARGGGFFVEGVAEMIGETSSNAAVDGGGCYVLGTATTAAIIHNNSASSRGGGCFVEGTIRVEGGARISSNFADNDGGGLYVAGTLLAGWWCRWRTFVMDSMDNNNDAWAVVIGPSSSSSTVVVDARGASTMIYPTGSPHHFCLTTTNDGGGATTTTYQLQGVSPTAEGWGGGVVTMDDGATTLTVDAGKHQASLFFEVEDDANSASYEVVENRARQTGGGVAADGTALLAGGIFRGNVASTRNGGAISVASLATLDASDTLFLANQAAESGGGAYAGLLSTARFRGVVGVGNTAGTSGGFGACDSCSLEISDDATIVGNTAAAGGGGLDCEDATASLDEVVIANNTASYGGGLRLRGGAVVITLSGVEFVNNEATSHGGAMFIEDDVSEVAFVEGCENVTIHADWRSTTEECGVATASSTCDSYYPEKSCAQLEELEGFDCSGCACPAERYFDVVSEEGTVAFSEVPAASAVAAWVVCLAPGNYATLKHDVLGDDWFAGSLFVDGVENESFVVNPRVSRISGNSATLSGSSLYANFIPEGWENSEEVASAPRELVVNKNFTRVASGVPQEDDPIRAQLFDAYGQPAITDEVARISNADAGTAEPFDAETGVATFGSLVVAGPPGTEVTVTVTFEDLAPANVVVEIRDCIAGEEMVGDRCVACAAGTFNVEAGAACKACEDNADCYGGTSLVPKKGYWRSSRESTNIRRCPFQAYCRPVDLWQEQQQQPRKNVVDAQCSHHHRGPLCALCESEFEMDPVIGKCYRCGVGAATRRYATFAAFGFFGFMIIIFCVGMVLLLLDRWIFCVGPPSFLLRARWDLVQAVLKVLLVFWQITAGLGVGFPSVRAPPIIEKYQQYLAVLSLDLTGILRRACLGGSFDALDILVGTTIAPMCGAAALVAFAYAALAARVVPPLDAPKVQSNLLLVLFVFSYVVLTSTSRVVARSLSCDDDFDHASEAKSSEYYRDEFMLADYSVRCGSRYRTYRIYAIYMLFAYPIGIPAAYLIALYRVKAAIAPRDVLALAKSSRKKAKEGELAHKEKASHSLDSSQKRFHKRRADQWKTVNLLATMYIAEHELDDEVLDVSGAVPDNAPSSSFRPVVHQQQQQGQGLGLGRPPLPRQASTSFRKYVNFRELLKASGIHEARLCALGEALVVESRNVDQSASHASFLFQEYDPARWYFEVLESLRRIVLTCAFPIGGESIAQYVVGAALALAFAAFYSHLQPYYSKTMDAFGNLIHIFLVLNFLCLLVAFSDQRLPDDASTGFEGKYIGGFLIMVNCVLAPCAGIVALIVETQTEALFQKPYPPKPQQLQYLRTEDVGGDEDHQSEQQQQNDCRQQTMLLRADSSFLNVSELVHPDESVVDDDPFVGNNVTVRNLLSRPSLNGRRAFCESYIEDAGRYRILIDGAAYALKPTNISLHQSPQLDVLEEGLDDHDSFAATTTS